MLTREEAEKLLKIVNGEVILYGPYCEGCKYNGARIEKIKNKINELTEKPRREIQLGDIYRDGNNNFVQIIEIKPKLASISYPLVANVLNKGVTREYTLDGLYDKGYTSIDDLDLSKRYKFVEIDDATI